jgi:hypothetical protein
MMSRVILQIFTFKSSRVHGLYLWVLFQVCPEVDVTRLYLGNVVAKSYADSSYSVIMEIFTACAGALFVTVTIVSNKAKACPVGSDLQK